MAGDESDTFEFTRQAFAMFGAFDAAQNFPLDKTCCLRPKHHESLAAVQPELQKSRVVHNPDGVHMLLCWIVVFSCVLFVRMYFQNLTNFTFGLATVIALLRQRCRGRTRSQADLADDGQISLASVYGFVLKCEWVRSCTTFHGRERSTWTRSLLSYGRRHRKCPTHTCSARSVQNSQLLSY